MASDLIVGPKTIPASADLSAYQFRFMKLDTNAQLALQTSSGGRCIGVLQDKPTAQGEPGMICRPGDITKVYAGNSITKGAMVSSDTAGKAIVSVTAAHILGYALDAASSGDVFRIVIQNDGTI